VNARSVSALSLAAHTWGAGRPRVLLIHGFGDGRFVWHAFESLLTAQTAGASIDLRGHGDSPRDALQRYDSASLTADVLSWIDTVDWPALFVVGHSLGGEIAARVAAALPSRVSGIVMVDSGPELDSETALRIRQELGLLPRHYAAIAEFEQILLARHPFANPTALRHYAHEALRPCAGRGFELKMDPALPKTLSTLDSADFWATLESIACPMLVVRGRRSAMLSRHQAFAIPKRAPVCQVAEVEGAGHGIPLENPRGLYDAVARFLGGDKME
jgi:pimeloyl-ACP methyl ester carboxylesterase